MSSDVDFPTARRLAVSALAGHYAQKFRDARLEAQASGRDLGQAWAVFLRLSNDADGENALVGAPVVIVSKIDGALSLVQIPPHFDVLDAPLVIDAGG